MKREQLYRLSYILCESVLLRHCGHIGLHIIMDDPAAFYEIHIRQV